MYYMLLSAHFITITVYNNLISTFPISTKTWKKRTHTIISHFLIKRLTKVYKKNTYFMNNIGRLFIIHWNSNRWIWLWGERERSRGVPVKYSLAGRAHFSSMYFILEFINIKKIKWNEKKPTTITNNYWNP